MKACLPWEKWIVATPMDCSRRMRGKLCTSFERLNGVLGHLMLHFKDVHGSNMLGRPSSSYIAVAEWLLMNKPWCSGYWRRRWRIDELWAAGSIKAICRSESPAAKRCPEMDGLQRDQRGYGRMWETNRFVKERRRTVTRFTGGGAVEQNVQAFKNKFSKLWFQKLIFN